MLDIPSLERRWLKYKIKRYLPYFLGITIVAAGIITSLTFFDTDKAEPSRIIKKETPAIKEELATTMRDETMRLEPSMQFIQSITPITSEEPLPTPILVSSEKKVLPIPKSTPLPLPIVNIPQPLKTPPPVPVLTQTKDTTRTTSIRRDSTPFDIHEIEDRFKNNANPHLGLYIARYHYDNGNYNEAYNYSLKTNAINNTLEESWLIFSKSLIKLGKSEQAKKTLQLYISQSNSEEAKSLLNNLNKEGGK